MEYKALEYLYRQLKEHKIALDRAQESRDIRAIDDLNDKIRCVEYLIDMVLKEM